MIKALLAVVAVIVSYLIYTNLSVTNWQPDIKAQVKQIVPHLTQKRVAIIASPKPTMTPVDADVLMTAVNQFRSDTKMPVMKTDNQLCPILEAVQANPATFNQTVAKKCPSCAQIVTAVMDRHQGVNDILSYLSQDSTASAILNNRKLTSSCVKTSDDQIMILAAQKISPPSPQPVRNISDDELWQALAEYRQDHKMNDLTRDDKLCSYAKKRLADQLKLYQSKTPQSAYPVPDKYPLDAHDGFKKDADSGFVFEITGKHMVAENLAYWPNAQYGTHVIEWGWDSSTEGHRETQLSNDYDTACLTGSQGFFVAIFGK